MVIIVCFSSTDNRPPACVLMATRVVLWRCGGVALWRLPDLVVEGGVLIGESAVLVHQEAEPPLLLHQGLLTAVRYEILHVHLPRRQRLQKLRRTSHNVSS